VFRVQAHHFGDRDGRVRVVELRGPAGMELIERPAQPQVNADHILQRAGHEEKLLLEPQLLALEVLVVRVQYLGDVLGDYLVLDGAVVVAVIECVEIERLDGLGLPQAQAVAGADAIAQDWSIIGDTLDDGIGNPSHALASFGVGPLLGSAAERHIERQLGSHNLPGVAVAEPFVGDFHLPAVADDLIEYAELVADAVSDSRYLDRGERIQVA